jgi:hypothetical protein
MNLKLKIESDKKNRDQVYFSFVVGLISHHKEIFIGRRLKCLMSPQFSFSSGASTSLLRQNRRAVCLEDLENGAIRSALCLASLEALEDN